MTSLENASVLVVGASSGVGRATALSLVAQNARVLAVARDRSRLERLRDDADGKLGIQTLDATDGPAVDALVRELRPDLIVLSAGVLSKLAPVDEHSWQSFSEPWNQDVKMAFELGQSALRTPLKAGSAVILVSSGAGLGGSPLSGGYAGAKRMQMFLASYLQRVSDEKQLGIRFVAIVPKQMLEYTAIGEAASAAYASRAGISAQQFRERQGPKLSAGAVADAILLVARGDLAAGATAVAVTGEGTTIL
jgi:NAD(P)-dependent dehydrogenase (short-subunit alcohol dehydrogenase family)